MSAVPKNRAEQEEWVETFLTELGRGIPDDERLMVASPAEVFVRKDADGKPRNSGFWCDPWKPGKYINLNRNAYVCISSAIKTPHPKTGVMRYWRSEQNFGHGLALMVDDIGDGLGSKGNIPIDWFLDRLMPSAIIETSPRNFQLWYFLDKPLKDKATFKALLEGFVVGVLMKLADGAGGGDRTIKDVTRIGRIPFAINNKRLGDDEDAPLKYPNQDGTPWRVRLRGFKPGLRYAPGHIAEAFGFRLLKRKERRIVGDAVDEVWLDMAVKILTAARQGEGSGGQVSINGSGKYRIICPWGEDHSNGDPSGGYFHGPGIGYDRDYVFGCAHDTCKKAYGRRWDGFIDEIVMPQIISDLDEANNSDWSV